MALALGAATAGNFSLFHAEPVDPRSGEPEAAIFCFPYGVLVNAEGERFVDEARGPIDAWYERTTRDIQPRPAASPGSSSTSRRCRCPTSAPGSAPRCRRSWRRRSRSLAAGIGVPADGPGARRWRRTTRPAATATSTRAHPTAWPRAASTPPKSNWARPISRGTVRGLPDHGRQRVHVRRAQDHRRGRGGRPRRPRDPRAVGGRRDDRALLLQLHRLHLGAARGDLRSDRRRGEAARAHEDLAPELHRPRRRAALPRRARAAPRRAGRAAGTTIDLHGMAAGHLPERLPRHAHRLRLPLRAAPRAVRAGRAAGAGRGVRRVPDRHHPRHRLRGGPHARRHPGRRVRADVGADGGPARRLRRHRQLHRGARAAAAPQPPQLPPRPAGRSDRPGRGGASPT